MFPKPKLFRKGKWCNRAKLAKRDAERLAQPKVELDLARSKHVNLIVNLERGGVYKNLPISREKNGFVDFKEEFEREQHRNYELINKKTGTLRSGKNKGEKVIKDEVNNPPKKRYYPYSWK
jgi:hypothetical protein